MKIKTYKFIYYNVLTDEYLWANKTPKVWRNNQNVYRYNIVFFFHELDKKLDTRYTEIEIIERMVKKFTTDVKNYQRATKLSKQLNTVPIEIESILALGIVCDSYTKKLLKAQKHLSTYTKMHELCKQTPEYLIEILSR